MRAGAEVRADGIIKKPFEPHELISIVVKFAEQFEAATPTPACACRWPPAAPEPTQEFALFERRCRMKRRPWCSTWRRIFPRSRRESHSLSPPGKRRQDILPSSQPAEMEVPYSAPQAEAEIATEPAPAPEFVDAIPAPEPPSAPAAETPLVVEEPPAPSPLAPPPPPPAASSIVSRRVGSSNAGAGLHRGAARADLRASQLRSKFAR